MKSPHDSSPHLTESADGFFLGAYAGFANLAPELKTQASEAEYRDGLLTLPHLAGLELPFYEDLHERDIRELMAWLPQKWRYIITTLPGTMNALSLDPDYGLASSSEEGRKAALSRLELVRRRIREIHDAKGNALVVGLEFHSAPRGDRSNAESLRRSLETLVGWDWDGVELILEHCDAWHADGAFSKGFLSLQTELASLKDLPVGIGLNWGRSVLEGRRVETLHRHIELSGARLRSLFFSGTAISDPLYGSWQDNHAAIRLDEDEEWEARGSLLTIEAIEDALSYVKLSQPRLGLKVQPFPVTLSLSQRLDFLKQQLRAVNTACASV